MLDNPSRLKRLEALASDNAFQQKFRDVKYQNKIALARLIGERLHVTVDPAALFDVQIKRIHEYKRQLSTSWERSRYIRRSRTSHSATGYRG